MSRPIEISVMVPCFNEAENVTRLTEAVMAELAKAGLADVELVFIDNASSDGTVEIIKHLAAADPRIRLIVNTRNVGQIRSPVYGLMQTSGAAVIGISADFQDPPELIGDMIARWRAGAKVVLAVRASEDAPAWMRLARAVFYGFMARFADYPVIPGATGYGLFDRQVIETLRPWRDPEPFWRGMLVESGYPIETIAYHRPPRAAGDSKNDVWSLTSFAISSVTASSRRLLRAPLYLAAAMLAIAAVWLVAALIMTAIGRASVVLWAGLAVEFGFALLFLFLGLIGEQVRLTAEIVRGTPLAVEKERINFP